MVRGLWLGLGLWLAIPGWATEPAADPAAEEVEDDVERFIDKARPALPEVPMVGPVQALPDDDPSRPYPAVVYRGAAQLQMDPAFVQGIREGLEKLYQRDYKGTRAHFNELERRWPNTGTSAVADVLVWQALMLENFDFKYDKQFWASSKRARADLDVALDNPGNEAWEYFMVAGVAGIEAIHTVRHEQYIKALQLAFEAIDNVEKTRSLAPDFTDLLLADGMYNYWRTVITQSSKLLPDYGDHRVEGIKQIQQVERGGIFLGPPATLAMVFTWHEENKMKQALASCLKNQRAYPDNVVNNTITGSTYLYLRKYSAALREFDNVLAIDPKNRRAHYWRGLALLKQSKFEPAEQEFNTYLAFDYMEPYQRSGAYYRLGQLEYRRHAYAKAEAHYKMALKFYSHRGAKRSLERMKKKRKDGTISY